MKKLDMELAWRIEQAITPEYRESPNGRGGVIEVRKDYSQAAALIEADRTAIRKECADKAIAWCNSEMMDMGAFEDEFRDAIEGQK
jgi:hypothetical protein